MCMTSVPRHVRYLRLLRNLMLDNGFELKKYFDGKCFLPGSICEKYFVFLTFLSMILRKRCVFVLKTEKCFENHFQRRP